MPWENFIFAPFTLKPVNNMMLCFLASSTLQVRTWFFIRDTKTRTHARNKKQAQVWMFFLCGFSSNLLSCKSNRSRFYQEKYQYPHTHWKWLVWFCSWHGALYSFLYSSVSSMEAIYIKKKAKPIIIITICHQSFQRLLYSFHFYPNLIFISCFILSSAKVQ